MASVAPLALHSSISGTKVAKVAPLVAHCTLHGTEGMTICFNISRVQKSPMTQNHKTFELEGTVSINQSNLLILWMSKLGG